VNVYLPEVRVSVKQYRGFRHTSTMRGKVCDRKKLFNLTYLKLCIFSVHIFQFSTYIPYTGVHKRGNVILFRYRTPNGMFFEPN